MYYIIDISTFNMILNHYRCNFYICKLLQYNLKINSNIISSLFLSLSLSIYKGYKHDLTDDLTALNVLY